MRTGSHGSYPSLQKMSEKHGDVSIQLKAGIGKLSTTFHPYFRVEPFLRDICKQCRPSSDAAERGV